ncbi:MAG: FGGY-family carbohydrate kinase [Pseudomonadota bacterium]
MSLSLGIDLGTSGIRCAVVDADNSVVAMTRGAYPDDSANGWWRAVSEGLAALKAEIGEDGMRAIERAAIDGTSGTMVLVDRDLEPVTDPLMYFSSGFDAEAAEIAQHAPPGDITRGSSSALARLLRLQALDRDGRATHMCHQADFILAKLTGQAGRSDENNCLKTGYDVAARRWPDWIAKTPVKTTLLPDVHPVGTLLFKVDPAIATQFGFAPSLTFCAGTTDSIAAFLATGVSEVGEVVTSLGTTLAIKVLSDVRIDDAAHGIYSHRLGDTWLVGGASNTGGGALLAQFDLETLASLSAQINPKTSSGLKYYPLPRPGERFPINDPKLEPILTPRPDDDVRFVHGLLEGITRIEAQCYAALKERGAPTLTRIYTAGGGVKNPAWMAIRERLIDTPSEIAAQTEAAIGAALLAKRVPSA